MSTLVFGLSRLILFLSLQWRWGRFSCMLVVFVTVGCSVKPWVLDYLGWFSFCLCSDDEEMDEDVSSWACCSGGGWSCRLSVPRSCVVICSLSCRQLNAGDACWGSVLNKDKQTRSADSKHKTLHGPVLQSPLSQPQIKLKLSRQFVSEYETDSLPKYLNYNVENKMNHPTVVFRCLTCAGCRIRNRERSMSKFPCSLTRNMA